MKRQKKSEKVRMLQPKMYDRRTAIRAHSDEPDTVFYKMVTIQFKK